MLFGNFGYNGKMKEIDEHVCPFDLVWDMEIPSASCGYDFILMNGYNSEPAYIEWGDGSTESLQCSKDNPYFEKFKMNADYKLGLSGSFFFVEFPPDLLSGTANSFPLRIDGYTRRIHQQERERTRCQMRHKRLRL